MGPRGTGGEVGAAGGVATATTLAGGFCCIPGVAVGPKVGNCAENVGMVGSGVNMDDCAVVDGAEIPG